MCLPLITTKDSPAEGPKPFSPQNTSPKWSGTFQSFMFARRVPERVRRNAANCKLGMSEHAQRFAENGIDISVLRHLTDQDLKDIGVLLGHRRKNAGGDC